MATTTYQDMSDLIAPFADGSSTGQSAADFALRYRKATTTKDVTELTNTLEITVVAKLEKAAQVTAAHFVPESAVAAGANSRDMRLAYDDGAGGAAVYLSALLDGTATAIVAGQLNSLGTITDLVELAAGSRIYFESTHNGTGAALNETMFEVEYRLV